MKKILLLLLLITACFQGFSQTPGISYQAVILNPNTKELPGANAQSSILANSNVAVRFTIINDSNNQEYQEYHVTKTEAYGMINSLIGHGTRIGVSYFEDILWNGLSKKLKIDIDFSGTGNNYTVLSEQELTFMPQPALGQDSQAILDNTASILAEVIRATNAESVIQSDVDTNEAARILADAELQVNIDSNAASTTTAIAAIQTDVDANKATSILADATLQTNINNVQADVDANEAASIAVDATLQTNIDIVQADVDAHKASTQTALDLKVDKVSGKGLSTEDYTTAEKTKLGAITGTNTGDQDISGIAINSSNIGDLTSLTTTNTSSMVAAINEIDTIKADLESPSFTGLPLAPTAAAGTNTTQIATTAFVKSEILTATASNGNYVTLNSAQTITGAKTFARTIKLLAQSWGNTATMNVGFAPNGESLSSIAMGINAAYTHHYGARVIAIGNEALYKDLRGLDNIGIGSRTLYNMTDTSNNDWGNRNVAIGSESGTNIIEGDNNTLIGTNTNTSTSVISNSVAIGYQAVVNANNTIQLGNTNVTLVNTSGAITSGGAITGTSIVKAGGTSSQYLMADGSVSTGTAPVREVADEFSATASQTNFTLTQTPSTNSKVKMFVNGIRISNNAYSVSGTTLTYNPANNGGYSLTANDRIQFDFYY
ncbi:MAG: hypothetical protein ACM31G_05915 [Flavobacteriales bacterium]